MYNANTGLLLNFDSPLALIFSPIQISQPENTENLETLVKIWRLINWQRKPTPVVNTGSN